MRNFTIITVLAVLIALAAYFVLRGGGLAPLVNTPIAGRPLEPRTVENYKALVRSVYGGSADERERRYRLLLADIDQTAGR